MRLPPLGATIAATLVFIACETPTGSPAYTEALIALEVTVDPICDAPVGARISLTGTYRYTCADADRCSPGATTDLDFTLTGAEGLDEHTLPGGAVAFLPRGCAGVSGRLQGLHPTLGKREVALFVDDDCTVYGHESSEFFELSDLELTFTYNQNTLEARASCPGLRPYSWPRILSFAPGDFACSAGGRLALGGEGEVTCQREGPCSLKQTLAFSYTLASGMPSTEVTLSDGVQLRIPFACQHASVSALGERDFTETLATMNGECELDPIAVDSARDVRVQASLETDPALQFTLPCE